MPAFNNRTVKPPRKGKPHIKFVGDWWRVSPQLRPYHQTALPWQKAHAFAQRLNNAYHLDRIINQLTRKLDHYRSIRDETAGSAR